MDWSPVVMNRPSDYISRHSDTKIHQLQIVISTSYFLCLHFLLNPSDYWKFPEKKGSTVVHTNSGSGPYRPFLLATAEGIGTPEALVEGPFGRDYTKS